MGREDQREHSGGLRAELLQTRTKEEQEQSLQRAAELLRAGGLVAVPTETVYGLAANAWDETAVRRIFEVKGRPSNNPLIVHVAGFEMARRCVKGWSERAERLARAFWPGPLTIVLERSERIPLVVTAGGPTVGIRWPAQPLTEQLIRLCGFPLAAPSANLSTRVSPTRPEHVMNQLGDRIDAILDAGPCPLGLESTVVDVTGPVVTILRPGTIGPDQLAAVLGEEVVIHRGRGEEHVAGPARSPGRLGRHYAPRALVLLVRWQSDQELEQILQQQGVHVERVAVLVHSNRPIPPKIGRVIHMPSDPRQYGAVLYEQLHQCDEAGYEAIVVEQVPEGIEWLAVRDRLERASKRERSSE